EILWKQTCCTQDNTDPSESSNSPESDDLQGKSWELADKITSRGLAWVSRGEETANDLIVASVKRVILTSEHTAALIHAATNICAIDDEASLKQLLNDVDFFGRLHGLYSTFNLSSENTPTALRNMPKAATKAFAAAILHLALSVGTIMDLAPPKDGALAIADSPQAQAALLGDLGDYVYYLARWVMLENRLRDGDLKDVSHLRLVAVLLEELIYGSRHEELTESLRRAIAVLADLTASPQLLRTLTCAVHLYRISRASDSGQQTGGALERLSQRFELAKTVYRGQENARDVPFLSDALQLCSDPRDSANRDQLDVYTICLDVFRHACAASEVQYVNLTRVFKSMGRALRGIEQNLRQPVISDEDRLQLREQRYQNIRIALRGRDGYFLLRYSSELGESWAQTLRYITDVASAQEPGHPENKVTLELFGAIQTKVQSLDGYFRNAYRNFGNEYDTFDAWVNMGGCAKTSGRLNRDPELCWCSYARL
ncbi:hypothetical protein FRC01_009415, partial [Tulasnella sp. 417]